MKLLALLFSLEFLYCIHAQDTLPEDRKLISYETKVFHKIPEHTIVEEKIEELKKIPIIEKKDTTGEEKQSSIPNYEFGYGVKDPVSGDHKDQWEKRHGDHVKGAYRFDESDGTQRVVEYEADGIKGFEATVKNIERKETASEGEEGTIVGKKEGKVAHSYSYLKRTGH